MVTPAPPRIVSLFWGISGVNNGCGMIGVRGLGEARREQCEAPAAAERRKKITIFLLFRGHLARVAACFSLLSPASRIKARSSVGKNEALTISYLRDSGRAF